VIKIVIMVGFLFSFGLLHAEENRMVALKAGYNAIQFNANVTLADMIEKIGFENLLSIQGAGQGQTYKKENVDNGLPFLNTFTQTELGKAYWIKVQNGIDLNYVTDNYEGNQTIDLDEGWNFVGPLTSLTLEQITQQIEFENLLVIQGAGQGATYKKENIDNGLPFLNTFTAFEESQGYWIKVENQASLIFDFTIKIVLKDLKAFPTAEGAGAKATGGRGGAVVYVTRVEDDTQEGSLRYALNFSGKKTIVFAVGGKFLLDESIIKQGDDYTFAGQTANDLGGVHIVGEGLESKTVYLPGSNKIFRYFTARGQWENSYYITEGKSPPQFSLLNSNTMIVDHFTGGWGSYCMNFNKFNAQTNKSGDFTLQRSLCLEGVSTHNVSLVTGFSIEAANDYLDYDTREEVWNRYGGEWDFHDNAFILNDHRQPSNTSGGEDASFTEINNYTYGWDTRLAKHAGNAKLDMINNVFEEALYGGIVQSKLFKVGFDVELDADNPEDFHPSIYVKGNRIVHYNGSIFMGETVANQFEQSYTHYTTTKYGEANTHLNEMYHREVAQSPREFPITILPTAEVKENVLNNVGAGVRFNSNGTTYIADPIDRYYITMAYNKSGSTFKHNKDKGYIGDGGVGDPAHFNPELYGQNFNGTSRDLDVWDSDRDGIPNEWEDAHGLDKGNRDDGNGIVKDWKIGNYTVVNEAGYTNVEIYLADIAGDFHLLAW